MSQPEGPDNVFPFSEPALADFDLITEHIPKEKDKRRFLESVVLLSRGDPRSFTVCFITLLQGHLLALKRMPERLARRLAPELSQAVAQVTGAATELKASADQIAEANGRLAQRVESSLQAVQAPVIETAPAPTPEEPSPVSEETPPAAAGVRTTSVRAIRAELPDLALFMREMERMREFRWWAVKCLAWLCAAAGAFAGALALLMILYLTGHLC